MRKPSLGTSLASLALVVALGGTAVAASRYVISSTRQIRPSVLRQLQQKADAPLTALLKGASPGGVTQAAGATIVARARSEASVDAGSYPVEADDPLSGASWTQHGEEDDLFFGQATVTTPTFEECSSTEETGQQDLGVYVDGKEVGGLQLTQSQEATSATTATRKLVFEGALLGPGKTTSRTLSVKATDLCAATHFKIDAVSVDVIGIP